jgi:N-acetylated-alpha-linked acidic dipeptidase
MRWEIPAGAWATIAGGIAATSLLMARPVHPGLTAPIDGFTTAHASAQQAVERTIARFPSPRRIEADHRFLTAEPHAAGSSRDRTLAEWTRDEWLAAGLDEVQIVEHRVLLPNGRDASVEMVAPHRWMATLREHSDDPVAFHAYGASGDVTAPVVDAGVGAPSDFDRLAARGIDVRGKIALVRHAVPYTYRGYVVYVAQQRGAVAVLMYADASDGGSLRGPAYPAGPWAPDERLQRGSVGFDFIAPGDPLTPGRPSQPGIPRASKHDAPAVPSIMSVPISTRDARTIVDALRSGEVTLHVRVVNDEAIQPIWTVIGRINGAVSPDEWVLAGNHRDAWLYGGVDPSSGSAVMMEMARALGSLARNGMRPKRTIILASWDAEEFALASSTEWGEEHERELRDKAIAYLNVDAAVSGPDFFARAVPSLAHVVAESAGVPDSAIDTRIGAGSDYTVFLNFVGIPVVDMRFQGPYGVYHSAFDTHEWVSRFADPGYVRHAALTRIWATLTLRLANADLLPLDTVRYAARIGEFLDEVTGRVGVRLDRVAAALSRFQAAARAHTATSRKALDWNDEDALDAANRALMGVEPAFLDSAGLRGRPWYRHLIYAPAFTYQPQVLPGISDAIEAHVPARLAEEERRLAAALDRAAQALVPDNVEGLSASHVEGVASSAP